MTATLSYSKSYGKPDTQARLMGLQLFVSFHIWMWTPEPLKELLRKSDSKLTLTLLGARLCCIG